MDLDEVLGGKPEAETTETAQPAVTETPAATVANPGETAAPPAATDTPKLVPLEALDAERKGRKDWKEKALRQEGEVALLKQQLEALKKAPVPTAEQQQDAQASGLPDPMLDPEGYAAAVERRAELRVLNTRWLDQEEVAKEKFGNDVVEAAFAALSEAAKADPSLGAKVRNARNPWVEIVNWHKKQLAEAEIGGDPVGFREKLEKEIREKILAEQSGESPTPASPSAPATLRIPSSLASTPSVAGRGSVAFTGPDKLGDIFDRKH